MGRWIYSDLGLVNLDQLAQLGIEGGVGQTFNIIGWSATGCRFAVRGGFLTHAVASEHLWGILGEPGVTADGAELRCGRCEAEAEVPGG